jgi:hypothetical protein
MMPTFPLSPYIPYDGFSPVRLEGWPIRWRAGIMLVAMARKLIVSWWRYVTCGSVPEGAVLKI